MNNNNLIVDSFHQGIDDYNTHGYQKQRQSDAEYNKRFVRGRISNTHDAKYLLWPDGKLKTH